ncbi:MAG TPA: hypothetical protein VF625_03920 [Longimicrobium sp.]
MSRYDWDHTHPRRELPMGPQFGRPHPADPNWADGNYHGNREAGGAGQAAYGHYRREHVTDLGGSGGFDGRYAEGRGYYDRDGIFRQQFDARPHGALGRPVRGIQGYDADHRPADARNGGVRGDNRYLQQYNNESVAFRTGRGYDRNFGWAPGQREVSGYDRSFRGQPLREHTSNGYNRSGYAQGNQYGPGPRDNKPNR